MKISFKLIKERLELITLILPTAILIYNHGAVNQIKNETIETVKKQSKHADSLAMVNHDDNKTILLEVKKGQMEYQKLGISVRDLGAKILTKEEFRAFIEPYLTEKKKFDQIQFCLSNQGHGE
jgi:hypothetical protein